MNVERELHIRTFAMDLDVRSDADAGLICEGLVVPFNVETEIAEPRRDGIIRYRESFASGSCERAMRSPAHVSLLFEHAERVAFDQRIGFGREFRESAEGLVGVFRLDRSRAEHARDVLSTSHRSLSVGFRSVWPKAGTERAGELVIRKSVILDHVACVPEPAYALAGITAFRGAEAAEPTDADRQAEQQQREDAELARWFEEHKDFSLPK